MLELIKAFENVSQHAEEFIAILVAVSAVIALAAFVYVVKTALAPVGFVLRWLFAYTPGSRPNDVVAGLIVGSRMLMWAAMVAAVVWFIYQWGFSS